MSVSTCCLKGFEWEGAPAGRIGKLANNEAYITGDNPNAAVMIIHDLLGWTFPNVRLLADHYAREANVTVYVPDFFGGEALPFGPIINGNWDEIDLPGFAKKNSREIREPWASALGGGPSSAWGRRSTSHRSWIALRRAIRRS
jgi:hypothetical protein